MPSEPQTQMPSVPQTQAPVPQTQMPSVPQTQAPSAPQTQMPSAPQQMPQTQMPSVPQTQAPVPQTQMPSMPQTQAPSAPQTQMPSVPQTQTPAFSPSQYNAVTTKIREGINKAIAEANSQAQRLEHDTGWIPLVGDAIKQVINDFLNLIKEAVAKIEEIMQWAPIPLDLWNWGNSWTTLATKAGQSSSELAVLKNQYGNEWTGIAGGKYQNAVSGQGPALDAIQSRSNGIASSCNWTAISGFMLYVSVAGALATLIAALCTPPPIDFVAIVGFIAACGVAITSYVFGILAQSRALGTQSQPSDAFPGGAWPQATN